MRIPNRPAARAAIRIGVLSLALAVPLLVSEPAGSNAASGGTEYNEVTRFITGQNAPPQPGTFAADYQAAVNAQQGSSSQPQHHGLFAAIQNMANAGKSAMAMFQYGVPTTYYFMNGWERTDNPGAQTGTIYRPDRHEIIHLDLAKKTYTIEDTNGPMTMPTESTPPPSGPAAPEPSPQPGTVKMDITVASTLLGPETIDGTQTTGYSEDFKMVMSQATGSCQNGSVESSIKQYLSDWADPTISSSSTKSSSMKFSMPKFPPSMAGAPRQGCVPTTTFHKAGSTMAPGGRLALWELATFSGGSGSSGGRGFSTLVERGDLKSLGPGDASLFDVPAGFTKQQ